MVFVPSSLIDMGVFLRSHFFIIMEKKISIKSSQITLMVTYCNMGLSKGTSYNIDLKLEFHVMVKSYFIG